MAGPSVLLAYIVAGIAIYIVMRALGEMAVHNPVSGSFSHYASQYISPLAGFTTGWTYVFEMVIVATCRCHCFWYLYGVLVSRCATVDLDFIAHYVLGCH